MKTTRIRNLAASLAVGAALCLPAASAAAANNQDQNGLVNVAIGDVTILQDVNIGVAAQVAANVCGVKVGPIAVLAHQVDATGLDATVCTTENGPVTFFQS